MALAACGGDEEQPATPSKALSGAPERGLPDPQKDAFTATCGDIERASRSVTQADFLRELATRLSRGVRLRDASPGHLVERFSYAVTDLCEKRESSYAPGKDAVAAVKGGEYVTGK